MATCYFLGGGIPGDWNDSSNWYDAPSGGSSLVSIPSSTDDAVILAPVSVITSADINSLTIDTGGVVSNITISVGGDVGNCIVQNGGQIGDNATIYGFVTCAGGGIIGYNNLPVFIVGSLTFSNSGSTEFGSTATADIVGALSFSADWSGNATDIAVTEDTIYYYGYTGTTSSLSVGGATFYSDYPTLYYYSSSAMDFNWNTLSNWYVDSGHTQQAISIPNNTQDVILNSDVTSDSSASATADNLTINNTGMNSGKLWINITVTTLTTFNNGTYYGDGANPVSLTSPTVTFNGDSYLNNSASIFGNVNFYDTSANNGSITGDATVYSTHAVPFDSSHGNTGSVSGSIIYSGYSPRTVYYYHTSSSDDWGVLNNWYNSSNGTGGNVDYIPNGDIALDTVIIESSIGSNTYGLNTMVGSLTVVNSLTFINIDMSCSEANFVDSSVFGYGNPSATLTHLTATNNINFADLSSNNGIINAAYPAYPVEFVEGATNDGTINGDVDVYYPSEKPIGGTVNGTVTYIGYTLYFAGGTNDGNWNTSNNWYLDSGGVNLYGIIPSETIPYQNVVLVTNVTSYTGTGTPSAANLSTYGTYPYVDNINITVYNLATFSEETYLGSAGTITGNALFENLGTNRGGSITGTATFTLSAAETMIDNGYDGTYGSIEFQYGKGVNGSSILGLV